MDIGVGTAPDSRGVWFADDPRQTPWSRCLDEVVEAGYRWIELGPYGYLPTDVPTLRAELDRRGLQACAAAALTALEDPTEWPELERQVIGEGEIFQALGAEFLVLIDGAYTNLFTGAPVAPKRLDADAWKRLIETSSRVDRIARERFGLTTVFHPHAETHVEYEDQIEDLLDHTDPALVSPCLDTGHHAYRGSDPIAFTRRHHRRIPYLRVKSVDPVRRDRVNAENIPFAHAVADDLFCEPSQGAVDFLVFRDMLREIDYRGFAIVEHDMYPAPFDKPLPIAKRTRQYLRDIGIG